MAVSPSSVPQTWVQEKQEGSACVLPLGEPKGVPRAKEAPKALSQRQQAEELMWLWSRKQHSQGREGPPLQPAHLVPNSALAHPVTLALIRSRPQAAFPQPPFPSVEYTMSSKCFLGAGVYWYLSRPPGENQESQAPLCSENGSSLVSASIRGPPHR